MIYNQLNYLGTRWKAGVKILKNNVQSWVYSSHTGIILDIKLVSNTYYISIKWDNPTDSPTYYVHFAKSILEFYDIQ